MTSQPHEKPELKYYFIIGKHTGKPIGACTSEGMEDALSESDTGSLEECTKESYVEALAWKIARRIAIEHYGHTQPVSLMGELPRDVKIIADEVSRELASLQSARDEWALANERVEVKQKAYEHAAEEVTRLRAALAERDREIEKLEAQCNLLATSLQGENNAHMKALRAGQVAEETITDLRSQLQAATTERLALEAQVGELRGFVKETHDVMPSPESTKLLTPPIPTSR